MEKIITKVGSVASVMAVLMYVSYIPQIMNNLSGHPGDFIQPSVAFVNCTLWVLYGYFKPGKDWPIIIANLPGIVCGFLAAFTAIMAR
ncbi:MAG: hypothetical protein HXM58_05885 [Megasphaera micronuciformis]|nr:hypothetical protein [Megasphaera micronuciformis]